MERITTLKDAPCSVYFMYNGCNYEVTSTSLTGLERRVYNHTKFKTELLPANISIKIKNDRY